jgi:hypothetical protein
MARHTSRSRACLGRGRIGSDTHSYVRRQPASGPTVNIRENNAPFQVAGDNAHQVQYVDTSAEHLRELVTSIAELIRLS